MAGFNIIAAETDDEAEYLASSMQQSFVRLRSGNPGRMPPPVKGYRETLGAQGNALLDGVLSASAIGSSETVREKVAAFIERTGVDELIVAISEFDHEARKWVWRLRLDSFCRMTGSDPIHAVSSQSIGHPIAGLTRADIFGGWIVFMCCTMCGRVTFMAKSPHDRGQSLPSGRRRCGDTPFGIVGISRSSSGLPVRRLHSRSGTSVRAALSRHSRRGMTAINPLADPKKCLQGRPMRTWRSQMCHEKDQICISKGNYNGED